MTMGTGGFIHRWRAGGGLLFFFICVMSGMFVLLRGSIGHLLGIERLDIDLIPIVLIYIIGNNQELRAGCLAFCMGILTDILAPSQLGLFAFVYSAIILGMYRCRQFLDFNNIKTSALFVALFILAKWAFLLIVLRLFPAGHYMPSISLVSVFVSALITSIATPPLFYVLDRAGGREGLGYDQEKPPALV
jgi:rod shape-determining protein MreD